VSKKIQLQQPIKTILLVDDEDNCRLLTKWFFGSFGYTVDTARNAEEALNLFDCKIHDAVITDNRMPGMTGSEMAHVIKMRSPSTPVVMYTGSTPSDCSCIDLVVERPTHLLVLKEALDELLVDKV
jgi:DNA-binding NtrC family response regulator